MPPRLSVDATDRAILDALQDDCTQPLARIGEKVELSAPSVLERVRKLERSGLVRGYHAELDARLAGLDITAFIGVGIDHPRHIAAFQHAVPAMPAVLECHHVTGQHTLILKVRVEDTASLHALIGRIRELEGVARTETMIVLETKLERQRIELPMTVAAPTARRRRTA
jgi:Lrp/AsnC family leucine-responsive transcriptional regulator